MVDTLGVLADTGCERGMRFSESVSLFFSWRILPLGGDPDTDPTRTGPEPFILSFYDGLRVGIASFHERTRQRTCSIRIGIGG